MITTKTSQRSAITPTADIMEAAEAAYQNIAEEGYKRESVHTIGVCHQASALMVNTLLENGHQVTRQERQGVWTIDHSYLALNTGGEEEIIIDPTWQQFLDNKQRNSELPKVLIGTRQEVVAQAHNFGIKDSYTLAFWKE